MFESDDELRDLDDLFARTYARANPHLLKIVKEERRLNARQVSRYLQGTKHVAFATVNERGEPREAPLDGVFIHGRFTVSTGGRAARLRHLRAKPACSAAMWTAKPSASSFMGMQRSSVTRTKASPTLSRCGGTSTARARSTGATASSS